MTFRKYLVASRGSPLALTQTKKTIAALEKVNPQATFDIVIIRTRGDKNPEKQLHGFDGIGAFVKELENELLEKKVDVAIHSLKDLPSKVTNGLVLASFPERIGVLDVLLTKGNVVIDDLPKNACVGTSSPRRILQISAIRPDLVFKPIRGNIDTRIKKLYENQYDAIVLAQAGMDRLGILYPQECILSLSQCVPASGQGALCIECRADDEEAIAMARKINVDTIEKEVGCERSFMRHLSAGCSTAVAAYACTNKSEMIIQAIAGDVTTGKTIRVEHSGCANEYETIGIKCAEMILDKCVFQNIVLTK